MRARKGIARACSHSTGRTSSSRRSRTSSRASRSTSTSATFTRSRTRTVGTRSSSRPWSGRATTRGGRRPVARAAARRTWRPAAGAAVRYLRPNERSAHDLSIAVDVDAGVAIEELAASHAIRTERTRQQHRARGARERRDDPEPRLLLALPRRGRHDQVESVDVYRRADAAGLFHAMVYPPADLGTAAPAARRDGVRARHFGVDGRPAARSRPRTRSPWRSIDCSRATRFRS